MWLLRFVLVPELVCNVCIRIQHENFDDGLRVLSLRPSSAGCQREERQKGQEEEMKKQTSRLLHDRHSEDILPKMGHATFVR